MTVTFRQKPLALKPEDQMIEVFDHGQFVAAIYPAEGSIRVVSKYIENSARGILLDPRDPPVIQIRFIQ